MQNRLVRAHAALAVAALSLSSLDAAAQPPPCTNTSVPCLLSAGLPPSSGVFGIAVAPNGSRVAFIHFASSTATLYSAPAGGGAFPVRLSPTGATNIANLMISADSSRVVYTASMPGSTDRVVFSVPIAGPESAGIRLMDNLPPGLPPIISPDSRKVVMMSAADRLRVVPIEGPAADGALLTDPMVAGARVQKFAISSDSHSVVYRADQETDNVFELYRVPLTLTPLPDPPTAKLSGPMVSGGDVLDFELSPVTGRLAYHADQDVNDVNELYTIGLAGGGRTKVSALPAGWDVTPPIVSADQHRIGYTIVADGSRVVYEIELRAGTVVVDKRLFSVPIAGPATSSVRLDDPAVDTMQDGYQVSSDGAQVVYMLWEQEGTNAWGMSVPVLGPASASVVVTFPAPGEPVFTLSPDGNRMAWLVGVEMYSEPIEGGANVRINGNETDVSAPIFINAAGARAVYNAVGAGLNERDLWSVPLSGSGTRYNLTQQLAAALINKFRLTGDGLRAVYEASVEDPAPGIQYHLYSSRLVP